MVFAPLPATVLEGSNLTITWDSSIFPSQLLTVAVRTSRSVLWDQSMSVGTVNSSDGILISLSLLFMWLFVY